jgi:acetyl-CoA/propionyl-CoA carboxylase biotin carboxyl carrier protein
LEPDRVFERVLVANRGEIAVRVMRTLAALGIESIAVYGPPDADALHVRVADRALPVSSYLDAEAIVQAALAGGAEAVHPGYGFLSENPSFAQAVIDAGLTWIGPPPEAIALMGDKAQAKEAARNAGVPTVPTGDDGGYPVVVKAVAGGGGKGMRVVRAPEELEEATAAAKREAQSAFGDDRVMIERYLERPRHIEVQVIADAHGNVLHLGERECSLQRRHQKVIEEAPSPVVDAPLRARMGAAACDLARAAGYVNAGTVEYIATGGEFFFLEMNARLQVEHPVTELVTGLDLVELQLRVAAGEPLPLAQEDVELRGHAVEARVYAEDAAAGFLPSTGRVVAYRAPAGAGVRVDSGITRGSEVTSDYDPMLAKVIAHGPDRATALARLERALAHTLVAGPTTNTPYLRALIARPEVRAGDIDTGLIERLGDAIAPPSPADDLPGLAVDALVGAPRSDDPWDATDGWRPGGRTAPARIRLDGHGLVAAEHRPVEAIREGDAIWIVDDGVPHRFAPAVDVAGEHAGAGSLEAPMPGTIIDVRAATGDSVDEGDVLVVMESMKMELSIVAPSAGTVGDVHVSAGDRVARGQSLVEVEA